ncbi:MAG TPA: sugar phosphate isomerase/epimerase [Devosia sp.]|nr:sugar phosphate isomerase/epimerase [Devosia sp.]
MAGSVELMNMFWTTAGIPAGSGGISPVDFAVRVKSAAAAGFKGVGLWHTDLEHNLVSRSLKDMKAILDDNGIQYLELEFLSDWFVSGARRSESDVVRKRLLEASTVLGAHHLKVGDFYSTPATMPQLIDAFGMLCREAEGFGARIGFEFMASAMLPSLKDSLAMIEGAGAQNGGVIVDIWHIVALGISYDELGRTPAQYIINVELNDGYPIGDPRRTTSSDRRFCGEGAFDIRGFVAAVKNTGYTGPWGVEVFARDLARLPQDELNRRAFETTMPYLAAL